MPRNEENEPLLPTSNPSINARLPTKGQVRAQGEKATSMLAAFKEGKMPTQDQLNAILQQLSNSSLLNSGAVGRTGRFSAEGQLVVEDARSVLESLIQVGKEKNSGDKFQRFIYHTTRASADIDTPDLDTSISTRELKKDQRKALDSLRTLGNLLITSPEFRNILSDITFLVRDTFADAASAVADKAKDAADKARPSEQERQQGVEIDSKKAKQQAKEIKQKYQTGRYEADAKSALASAREWIDEQTPTDAKDEVIERLKKLVVSIQKSEDYHSSINTLIDLLKKYGQKAADAAHEVKDKTDVETDDDAQEAMTLLREIIETYANGKSLDDIFKAFDRVIQDIKSDDRLTTYFDDVEKFIDRLLHDEGYVLSQKASRKAESFVDRAQQLIESNSAWKADSRALVDELRAYQSAIEDDKALSNLTTALSHLSEDLGDFGASGFNLFSAKAKGFLRDFYDVILPRMISNIKHIPLPRIEYTSAELDLAIDDFVLESASFIPDKIELTNFNDLVLEQGYAAFASNAVSKARLQVTGLRFSASNIAYYVCSKSGWGWEDSGLLSIDLEDDGLSFDVELETASDQDRESFYKVKKVNVNLDNLDFSISRSDHWFLNTIMKPFVRPYISSALVKALEGQIQQSLQDFDLQLYGFQQRVVAASNASPSLAGYFRALWANTPSPFSSSSSAQTKHTGTIITGAHGEYRLAIGATELLLPGRGGPSSEYEHRRQLVEEAKAKMSRVVGTGQSARGQAYHAVGTAQDQVGSLATDLKKKQRKEAAISGWQSSAFDI